MELTEAFKTVLQETAQTLRGAERRRFLATTVEALGSGGQRRAERELGWDRKTIRKGLQELHAGFTCYDAYCLRGRKAAEVHLPTLLDDIKAIVDSQSQTDPQFRSKRLYTRLTAAEVRRQLIAQKGYTDEQLPSERTIRTKLNLLGYHPTTVAKAKPKKKIAQTDAIFERLAAVNQAADDDPESLRLSMDAKATVKIGPFARGGKSRVLTKAADHDFRPEQTVTPVGVLLPKEAELLLSGVTSRVTSDCLVDQLEAAWELLRPRFGHITTLVLNLDNGPECHSRRSQFMQRLLAFADRSGLMLKLAYYPPYHSKYNPIERCWGILERHWNGSLLDSLQGTLEMMESMTWCGIKPVVELVTTIYQTGVRLSKAAMEKLEQRLERDPQLGRWFLTIRPQPLSE